MLADRRKMVIDVMTLMEFEKQAECHSRRFIKSMIFVTEVGSRRLFADRDEGEFLPNPRPMGACR
jgi:hypothetical protein